MWFKSEIPVFLCKSHYKYIYRLSHLPCARWLWETSAHCSPSLSVLLISEHYATVTLTFTDKGNETELKIECRAVPESEEERTRDGWQRYYCHAIKQTFGYGARLCWGQDVAATLFGSFLCFIVFIFHFVPPTNKRRI